MGIRFKEKSNQPKKMLADTMAEGPVSVESLKNP